MSALSLPKGFTDAKLYKTSEQQAGLFGCAELIRLQNQPDLCNKESYNKGKHLGICLSNTTEQLENVPPYLGKQTARFQVGIS